MTRTLDGQSPSRVQSYLGGVSYPASKDQLLDVAKQNRAPVGVLEILRRLNEISGQFGGPQDVRRACVEDHHGFPLTTASARRARPTSAQTARSQTSSSGGPRRRSATATAERGKKERP